MVKYHYTVHRNELITPTVRLLTLHSDEHARPLLHQPGQYAAISLHDRLRPTVARCFSIVSSPTQQHELQFSSRVGGRFTTALERLQEGDKVVVRGPFGGFVFDQRKHRDLVLFSGGIGIAPFMSMIRYAAHLQLENDIHLVYSVKNQDDIPFFEELKKLEQKNPKFKVSYAISAGDVDRVPEAKFVGRRIDQTMLDMLGLDYSGQTYMICGPAAYMEAVHGLLLEHGVTREHILTEAFSQGSYLQAGERVSWPFNAYALTGLTFAVIMFFVALTDLNKTLPQLTGNKVEAAPTAENAATVKQNNLINKINSLGPQVETNIAQPVVVPSRPTGTAVAPAPAVSAPAPTVVSTPPPAPAPTVIPQTRPRTRVS